MILSSKVVSFTSTSIKKYHEILGTVRMIKCHGNNQFFLSFTLSVVLAQTLVCKTRHSYSKNLSLNG